MRYNLTPPSPGGAQHVRIMGPQKFQAPEERNKRCRMRSGENFCIDENPITEFKNCCCPEGPVVTLLRSFGIVGLPSANVFGPSGADCV